MKRTSTSWIGILAAVVGLAGSIAACDQSAAQPAPQAQPIPPPPVAAPPAVGADAKKPEEPPHCTGPDGKEHTFPLHVYDENADGGKTIADGLLRAKAEGKRVVAMWGENWCQFCLFLEDILANDPGCKPVVKSDYVWVRIDFGQGFAKGTPKNKELAEFYGVTEWTQRHDGKTMGAPALCIIDPDTGRTVGIMDPQRDCLTGVLGGNDMVAHPMLLNHLFDEQVIKKFLIENRPSARPAVGVMNGALARAKSESKKVFALFTMPGDDGCEKASDWLSRPDVAAAIGHAFTIVTIDTERMTGGEMLQQASGKPVFPPFMTVLDDSGKPIADAPRFTALPKTDAEIDAFVKGLSGAAKMTDADKSALAKSLKEVAIVKADDKKP